LYFLSFQAQSDILVENGDFFFIPICIRRPVRGPRQKIAMLFSKNN